MTRLTYNQLAVMSAVLGVSNSGSDHLFAGKNPEVTPERVRQMVAGRSIVDVDSVTTQIVSGLCENEAMLENFLEEARSWVDKLSMMPIEKIKSTWPRYAAFVECAQ